MSTAQVGRLQALLSRVQVNRAKPRAVRAGNGVEARVEARVEPRAEPRVDARVEPRVDPRAEPRVSPRAADPHLTQPIHTMAAVPAPTHVFESQQAQDAIDTTPPPAAFPRPEPHVRPSAEPARRVAVEPERVRVPEMKPAAPAARGPAQPERPMPAPARPTAPGATPLEMALEGEVARAAESAAAMPAPAARPQPAPQPVAAPVAAREEALEHGGRMLADPTPPQPTRPIAQAVTKHPPTQPGTFTELLKRSLALRPR